MNAWNRRQVLAAAAAFGIAATSKPQHMTDNLGAGFGNMPDPGQRKRMAEYFTNL